MKIDSAQAMIDYGRAFAQGLKAPAVIELIGDVGAGKTTFVQGLAEGLGVAEAISSPSYTISKRYALPSGGELIHYDFYRLGDPGLMAEDLAEAVAGERNIVVIEWGESVAELLPEEHMTIEITMEQDGSRRLKINHLSHWT